MRKLSIPGSPKEKSRKKRKRSTRLLWGKKLLTGKKVLVLSLEGEEWEPANVRVEKASSIKGSFVGRLEAKKLTGDRKVSS